MNKISIFSLAIHGLVAFMSGVVKTITEGQELVLKSFTRFLAGGLVGVFAGMVTYFVCRHFEISEHLTVAFTGLAGYMGVPLLELFSFILKRTILGLFGFHIMDEENENK